MAVKNKASALRKDIFISLLPVIIEFAYFTSCLINTLPLLRAILVLPSLFVIPGAILLAVLRRTVIDIVKLMVEGFFVSTLISMLLTSIMLSLSFPLNPLSYSLTTLVITSTLSIIALIRKIEFTPSKSDFLLIAIAISSYIVLLVYLNGLPRLFTADETSYIADIRDIVLKGKIISSWSSIFSSELTSLLTGRFLWLLLGSSFLGATGLPSYELNLLSVMFLPMIALASCLLVPPDLKYKRILQAALFFLIISNPLLVEFSDFILNDLAVSFYTLLSITLFIKSIKTEDDNAPIDLKSLMLCFLLVPVVILIKPNLLFLFPLYIILVGFMLKNKLYRIGKYKAVILALIIPPLAYELVVDIPYVLVVWWKFGNESFRYAVWSFTKRFVVLGSPAESFLGWFISTPWKQTTVFSYDYFGYLNYLYRFLCPEALGLLFAGISLGLPAILFLKDIGIGLQTKLLTVYVSISLFLLYFTFLSNAQLGELNRYCLFIYPLITVVSLKVLYMAFSNSKVAMLISLIIPSVFLVQINNLLSTQKGGVYIGYALPKINWTGTYLQFQLVIYLILIVIRTKDRIIQFRFLQKYSFKLQTSKMFLLFFIFSIFLSNVYFTGVFLDNSTYFEDTSLSTLNKPLNGLNTTLIMSNSFIYLRDFVDNSIYLNNYILPLPMTSMELNHFIGRGFGGSRIIAIEDPLITNYEYANAYKKELLYGDFIFPASEYMEGIYSELGSLEPGCILNLIPNPDGTFEDVSSSRGKGVAKNTKFIQDTNSQYSLLFNGKDSFIEFEHNSQMNITDALSVRIWFKTSAKQRAVFLMHKDNPYTYGIYLTSNSTLLSFYVRLNKAGVVTADFKGTFDDDSLYDVVGIFDGRNVKLYVNGLLRSKVDVGFNDSIVTSSGPLWIGTWARDKFFNGTIYSVRIYNRALTTQEIQMPYLKDRPYAKPVYETRASRGKVFIYQVEAPVILHKATSDILIKNVKVDVGNYSLITLKINISSPRPENLTIIVGTICFSKILNAKVDVGDNSLEYPFEYKLPDGRSYGFYIAGRCSLIILDEGGNIIYDDVLYNFQLTGVWLLLYIGILLLVLVLYVVLSSNIKIFD